MMAKLILRSLLLIVVFTLFWHRLDSGHALHDKLLVGVDTHFGRDVHGLSGHIFSRHVGDIHQGASSSHGIKCPTPHPHDTIMALQHVAITGDLQADGRIRHQHGCLQAPQILIRPPPLGQFHATPGELPGVLVDLPLEAFQEREGVGGGSREPHDDPSLLRCPLAALIISAPSDPIPVGFGRDAPDLPRVGLDGDVPHGNHPVPDHAHPPVLPDAEDSGRVPVSRAELGGGRLGVRSGRRRGVPPGGEGSGSRRC
mmetsp:Transcript_132/g.260  ORF Transcript_132/g.260 Transcript_132/m.260 type:complete len:256 (-) Transcript_132:187-954(-)